MSPRAHRVARLALLLLSSSFWGCANLSSLQTARALPTGTWRAMVGFGYFQSPTLDEQINKGNTRTKSSLKFPYVEFGGRYGAMQNLEVGAKLTLPGFLSADGKYQLVDQGGLAIAGGLGIAYLGVTTSSQNSSTSFSGNFADIIVPAYLSYDITPWFSIYSSPKYLVRLGFGSAAGTAHLGGTTAGVRFGNRMGVFVEGTYMKAINGNFSQWQFNTAFYFGNGSSVAEAPTILVPGQGISRE